MSGNGKYAPEYIRKRRNELNLTQKVCAGIAGVHLNTWKKWERGLIKPSPNSRMKIDIAIGDTIKLTPQETRKVMNVIVRCGIYIDGLTQKQKDDFAEVYDMLNEKPGEL